MKSERQSVRRQLRTLAQLICFLFFFYVGENIALEIIHVARNTAGLEQAVGTGEEPGTGVATHLAIVPPQFVVFSFDGSKSLRMWKETLDFADKMRAMHKPLSFTYFLSGIYMLTPENAAVYKPPQREPGASDIGYGDGYVSMRKRIAFMSEAVKKGHEVGSHAVGHLNGLHWTSDDWTQEFGEFRKLLFGATQNNPGFGSTSVEFGPGEVIGFRAPYLAINAHSLSKGLHDSGYKYDASGIANPRAWPRKSPEGVWEFPLKDIFLPLSGRATISMDYSIYMVQSDARDTVTKDTPQWERFKDDTLQAYMKLFSSNYQGNRSPISIGHHFTQMNDGAYWAAEKQFAENVCGLPEVRCVTYRELVKYMDSLPPGKIDEFQKSVFPLPKQMTEEPGTNETASSTQKR